jgi:predicted DNA repair protein MutK
LEILRAPIRALGRVGLAAMLITGGALLVPGERRSRR